MGPKLRYIIKVMVNLALSPFKLCKVKSNKVFLLNDLGGKDANYSSNPKYIAKYILDNNIDYQIVFALGPNQEMDEHMRELDITFVRLRTFKYYYHALTSKFFITTSGGISYLPFKNKQIVINSWHGGGAYKKMGLDADNDDHLRKALLISERKTDYFISSNKYFSDAIKTSFLIPDKKIVDFGLPRNDIFYSKDASIKKKVYNKYGIPLNTKIVMYAPTYRSASESIYKKHELGPYDIDFDQVISALKSRFGGDWMFAIRLHPSISNEIITLPDNVLNFSDYDDPQELMYASDILINDYSSTMWDFSQTRKPCFIYASDLANYDTNLGFYTTPQQWPFPLSETNEELEKNIVNFNSKDYEAKLENYFNWMESYDKGHACEQLINLMNEIRRSGKIEK